MFYHLSPEGEELVNEIRVPVLGSDRNGWVEGGTAGVVLLGFLWVLSYLWGVWRREGYGSGNGRKEGGEKKNL